MDIDSKTKKKILIADNSHTIRHLIKRYVDDKYEVVEAKNGKEIIAACNSQEICLALISMEYEDINGLEVAVKLREKFDNKTLPIILNTSNNKREDILKALGAGFSDYIVKPFPKELLVSKIQKLEREIPVRDVNLSRTISQIPFFHGVPEGQVAFAINTCAEILSLKKGDVICKQDDENHDVIVLLEGKCDVIFHNKKVSELEAIDTIGEMGFIEEKKRSATVLATGESKLIVFNKELFDNFLNEDRAISEIICKNIIRTLSDRIKRSNTLIEQLKIVAHQHLIY